MIRTLGEFLAAMFHRIRGTVSRRLGLEMPRTPAGVPLPQPAPPAGGWLGSRLRDPGTTDHPRGLEDETPATPAPDDAINPHFDPVTDPAAPRESIETSEVISDEGTNNVTTFAHPVETVDVTPLDHRNGVGDSIGKGPPEPPTELAFAVMTATSTAAVEPSAVPILASLPFSDLEASPPEAEAASPPPASQPSPLEEPRMPPEPFPSPDDFLKSSPEPEPEPPQAEPAPPQTPHDHDHILSAEEEEALAEFLGGLDAKADLTSRAKESLEETLAGLKLTREEENALADEIRQLRDLAVKLDENVVEIAAFGLVSRGKSSVLNALLGREAFKTGSTHGTTTVKTAQDWQSVTLSDGDDPDSARLVLVDTPGIDEVGGEAREALARDVAQHADLLLFVVSSDMQRREYDALAQLREAQKPIILVFNQIDRYPDADRDQVYETIRDERVRHLVRPDDVVMTAARPDPYKVKIRNPDGTTTVTWERPDPVIEPLKARILEVLHREGKALVALNTLLFAGDLHHEIVAHKMHIRDGAANKLIWNFCLAKGAAVGLNPIPVADMAGGLAVDVAMIVALSRAYGIALTRRTAITLVKDMVKALGALGVVEVASRLVVAGIKSTLAGLSVATGGLALFGYGAVGLAQGVTAAYTSYILGQGAKVYLQQGCQWGSKGIKTVIQQILDQAKADSVMDRLRDDLKKKVHA